MGIALAYFGIEKACIGWALKQLQRGTAKAYRQHTQLPHSINEIK